MAQVTFNLSQSSLSSGWDPDAAHDAYWQRFAAGYSYEVVGGDGTLHDSLGADDPATGGSANSFQSDAGSLDLAPTNFRVDVSLDWLDATTARLALDAAWNSIKNIEVDDFSGDTLILENWVDVWVSLERDTDQEVRVDGAKRGEVTTGSGDDTIWIGVDSNSGDWNNIMKIATGDGADMITVTVATRDYSGSAFQAVYDPSWTHSVILAGAGDDVITGGRSTEIVDGGSGEDRVILHGPRDAYDIIEAGAIVTVIDTRAGAANRDGTDVLTGIEFLQFDDGVQALSGAADTDALLAQATAPSELQLFG
ncbi:hypothetical protein GXW71_32030 [Roseomonas hellenica]|uniref:Uncharacterized protein n=1 Tax=Plastoroseomonas hellenica TaxID=2687306 RepID=A0ABS5F8Y9_9PROT|nr:hypothetical protein [Plastoroseomonas hellenica]MBR0669022.1 hypothetical protein [Plastoroseomonas hellenica]